MNGLAAILRNGMLILLLMSFTAGATAADDEGVHMGLVRQVNADTGYAVIGDQRYAYNGQRVQPPPDVNSESKAHRTQPLREGMIVRFTLKPGNPPGIHELWALD